MPPGNTGFALRGDVSGLGSGSHALALASKLLLFGLSSYWWSCVCLHEKTASNRAVHFGWF